MRHYLWWKVKFWVIAFFCASFVLTGAEDDWRIAKSTHFIIHYKGAPEEFLTTLAERAEDYYDKIAEDLGFRRYNFWLWDNRAKIYIYDDASSYQAATAQPSWSMGSALPKDKVIHAFVGQKKFFDVVLPHEIGHIIFREFVGFDNPAIPLWLDEAVASYQEKSQALQAHQQVRKAIEKGTFIPLEKLCGINQILMFDQASVNLFYAEGRSIIDYLIKEFGKDNFVRFCQDLRDRKNLERALASSYGFKNIQELEQAWQRYLKQ